MDYHDILSTIFNLNTNISNDHPLETARRTSQVCSLWRRVMLTSSEIWGKCLELSELQVERDDSPWGDLVLERTGIAPLFFRGKLPPSRANWFMDLISTVWGRVVALDIVRAGTTTDDFPTRDLNFMKSDSSCIALNLPYVYFSLDAPWIHNIRSITLGIGFNTTKLLKCLASMPCLEQATLSPWFTDYRPNRPEERPVEPQRIYLPLLTDLRIEHIYTVAADVLERIEANDECVYFIVTIEDATTTNTQRDIFSSVLQRQIKLRPGDGLNVYISDGQIAVSIGEGAGTDSFYHIHSIDLTRVSHDDVTTYMSLFYTGNTAFDTVTHVNLTIDVPNEHDIQHIFDSVAQFLLFFPSVTTLELSQQSLFLITRIYRPNGRLVNEQLFPSLNKMLFGYSDTEFKFPVQDLMMIFLDQRRSYARPIKELTFGPNVEKLNLHWGCLEEFDDMKVGFQLFLCDGRRILGTYVCGSGEPEELDLTEGWEDRFFQGI